MPITLTDRAPLEKVRRLADGRLAATAKFARAGCYIYSGHEVGRPDLHAVTVYRPESEVFAADAMASFAHKTITVGHPPEGVTADNWKNHAAGWSEGKVVRDGEYIEIPLMLADAAAVAAYDAGTRELSAGYSCDLVWGDGVAPDGTRYAAKQTSIRGNHIALVAQGRAGSACRIGDTGANPAPVHDVVKETRIGAPITEADIDAARVASERAYQASKASPNSWRTDPKPQSAGAVPNSSHRNQY